jgi:hypothetical protein
MRCMARGERNVFVLLRKCTRRKVGRRQQKWARQACYTGPRQQEKRFSDGVERVPKGPSIEGASRFGRVLAVLLFTTFIPFY